MQLITQPQRIVPKSTKCLSGSFIEGEKGNIYLPALASCWSKVHPQSVNYPTLLGCTYVGAEWSLLVQCQ